MVSTHLRKMLVKLDHFPTGRVKRTNIWNHQKNSPMRFNVRWPSNAICSSPERLAATPRCKVTWWSMWHDVMVAWWILVLSSYITIHPWKLTCALEKGHWFLREMFVFRSLNTRLVKSNGSFFFKKQPKPSSRNLKSAILGSLRCEFHKIWTKTFWDTPLPPSKIWQKNTSKLPQNWIHSLQLTVRTWK